MTFTDQQKQVLELNNGLFLVLAPPGSGKTELLSHKILKEINDGVPPEKIACLTFTNRAARNMEDRLKRNLSENQLQKVFVGNMHSFSLRFLKENDLLSYSTSLLDEEDSELLMKEAKAAYLKMLNDFSQSSHIVNNGFNNLRIFAEEQISKKINWQINIDNLQRHLSSLLNMLSKSEEDFNNNLKLGALISLASKNNRILLGIDNPEMDTIDINNIYFELLKPLFAEYDKLKNDSHAIDFNDFLNLCQFNLTNHKTKLSYKKFDVILVDEIQDLNYQQIIIINELLGNGSTTILFGDYEQAIFSFIGAKIEYLNTLKDECNKVIYLSKNFRSPSYLLEFFNSFALSNLNPLWESPPTSYKSERAINHLKLYEIKGFESDERLFVVNSIKNLSMDRKSETIAVLLSTNKEVESYSNQLRSKGINHFKVGATDLFRYKEIKDLFAFLEALNDPNKRFPWVRLFQISNPSLSLKQSRQIINDIYNLGIRPYDILDNQLTLFNNFFSHFQNKTIVVFDTETTGLETNKDDIIQLSAVKMINGIIIEKFDHYIKTDKEITQEAFNTHKISKEFLEQNGELNRVVYQMFIDFIKESVLIAHNLKFDYDFIDENFKRSNISYDISNHIMYDSLDLARRVFPKSPNHKLKYLCKSLLNYEFVAHNSLEDVKATAKLLTLINEHISNKINDINSLLNNHSSSINNFNKVISPLWQFYNKKTNDIVMPSSVLNTFFDYLVKKHNYTFSRDYELNKITQHMDKIISKISFIDLLKFEIPYYFLYKETDLLLDQDHVIISTIHRAKGLEFDTVFVPNAHHKNFPKSFMQTQLQYSENKKLLYVALTRAKENLIISHPTFGKREYLRLSDFLKSNKDHFEFNRI